jgi:DNA-binding winged helix-turn-helix (wHTH) protein
MGNQQRTQTVIRFGSFEADLHSQELRRGGTLLRLPSQSFQVLQMLLERRGTLVTRDELRAVLWPSDTFVDFDHGLHAAVNRLREAPACEKYPDKRYAVLLRALVLPQV